MGEESADHDYTPSINEFIKQTRWKYWNRLFN